MIVKNILRFQAIQLRKSETIYKRYVELIDGICYEMASYDPGAEGFFKKQSISQETGAKSRVPAPFLFRLISEKTTMRQLEKESNLTRWQIGKAVRAELHEFSRINSTKKPDDRF